MRLLASLEDNEFPFKGIKVARNVVRALVFDENGNVALHHVYGIMGEEFGLRDYYETPGGGVEGNEPFEVALKRECLEELGYEVEIIAEIGEVDDYYNLLERKNLNHYYLCRRIGEKKELHFASKGDQLIEKTIWVSLSKAKELYEAHEQTPLARLVYNREYRILLEGEKILNNLRARP